MGTALLKLFGEVVGVVQVSKVPQPTVSALPIPVITSVASVKLLRKCIVDTYSDRWHTNKWRTLPTVTPAAGLQGLSATSPKA